MTRIRTYNLCMKSLVVRLLALILTFSSLTILPPPALATEAETTPEFRKGCLFLKANVPDDFYHVVCAKLKDKDTGKDLTLKVEGGSVFEVFIKLPDGEYEVVSAFVEDSDQFTVTYDVNEITISAETCPHILLDVQPKTGVDGSSQEQVPSISTSDETDAGFSVGTEVLVSQDNQATDLPDEANEDTTKELLNKKEEDETSNSSAETAVDICLSILTAVIFFAIIALVVYVVRNKMEE